jgi:hypothetical protein
LRSFERLEVVEIALCATGLIIAVLLSARPQWRGFGVALAIQAALAFGFDSFAARRARVYAAHLERAAAEPRALVQASSAPSGSAAASSLAQFQRRVSTYNVLLIMIDSLRADMPWTGYERNIAPKLSALVDRCVSYTRGYSLSSYTAKSVAPALVGKYASEMPRDGYFFTRWLPDNLFVSERAQKAKVRTLAGHGHGYFMRALGLDQGFDDYRLLPGTVLDPTGVHNVTSEALNALAKTMLKEPQNTGPSVRRFFAYFHFLDPHFDYYKHPDHPDYGDNRRDLYDNEVHYTDHWVGDLIAWARAQPWGKDTAVIVTADHGEGFGERGQYRHAFELWESLVRVPLVICVPGVAPRRLEVPRSHIDLAPTIAELLGLDAEPPFEGKSLLAEVAGTRTDPRPIIVDLPRCDLMDRRRALIDGAYKLIAFGDDTRFMLFDVIADPREENDLSASKPEQFARMRALYDELSKLIPTVPVTGGADLMGAPAGQRW